eukprot:COSAG05_NODE_14375_length_398_cov_1.387960_1_plen_79_part_10
MTRYREVHDFLHVLTGLPPTVEGEIALKTLEAVQVRLPIALLSSTAHGPVSPCADWLTDRHTQCTRRASKPEAAGAGWT